MYKILVFFTLTVLMSCGMGGSEKQKENDDKTEAGKAEGQKNKDEELEQGDSTSTLQLNNGKKWKADSITLKNVASLTQLVNDKTYDDKAKRSAFQSQLQNDLDILVKECRMSGPAHEALHAWLKPVIHNTRELKDGEGEYDKKYAQLRNNVQSFYDYFD